MQVYLGRKSTQQQQPGGDTAAPPEKNQGTRVVLDLTTDLLGPRNVTCDNFFTSYELGQRLLDANLTVLGTVRKNRPELPPALVSAKGRDAFSTEFAFATEPGTGGTDEDGGGKVTTTTTLLSYVPKKKNKKNVVLMMTTLPWRRQNPEPSTSSSSSSSASASSASTPANGISDRPDRKPQLVLKYNATKGGVDNLDKLLATYSCRRMTSRWPMAVFHNILDVSAYNAYVIWRETKPGWLSGYRNKRRFFLEQLGKALVAPLIQKRRGVPRADASLALVLRARSAAGSANGDPDHLRPNSTGSRDQAQPQQQPQQQQHQQKLQASKRKRCQICPAKKDSKTFNTCRGCSKYICRSCAIPYCPSCVATHAHSTN